MAAERIPVIVDPGTAREYQTGSWRSKRPVVDKEKCIDCLICWMYCPDNSVLVENGEMKGFRLTHCKGCGICAHHCPKNCITMVEEGER
ncbi:4Fe-4S binding protein [Methanomassiliicoccus luminyensis]|jgi:pyruvate ferredoxin oxidoreductase delta subunit|uniref:4Fe-4S binding protein n=1 Tax=Methanomassiliicoccus luminyensis TaxID=1080712 RepID=UPI00037C5621|nr:4Fe-4S binding protein [Methanomassiliicoccus luminyensis]